jgi:hypothetical protein
MAELILSAADIRLSARERNVIGRSLEIWSELSRGGIWRCMTHGSREMMLFERYCPRNSGKQAR